MSPGGYAVWRQAASFHWSNWRDIFPVFPLLCVPVLGDALHTLLVAQGRQAESISPRKAVREVWALLPPLFVAKLHFECAALLWALVPIYGIIRGVRHRQYWAMASNVLVMEGMSGKACRRRCRELVDGSAGGIGVRTLVTIPSLLLTAFFLAWVIADSTFEQSYSYGYWLFIAAAYWVSVPLSGAVNTFLYLAMIEDSRAKDESPSSEAGALSDGAAAAGTVSTGKRGGWIWVISVYYLVLSALVMVSYFLPTDPSELSAFELAYEQSLTTFDLVLDHFVISVLFISGAVSLLLLRQSAFLFLVAAFALDMLHIGWEIYARGLLQAYPARWLLVMAVFSVVNLLTCLYTWRLRKAGALR